MSAPRPPLVVDDGKDFVPTNRWMAFGHHFAAIAGPGPLVGPVLAAQFGYLPGMLWILIGATLGGGVHDMIVLFASVRRREKRSAKWSKKKSATRRRARARQRARHHGHFACRPCARCGAGAGPKSVGSFHDGDDHSRRADHGNRSSLRSGRCWMDHHLWFVRPALRGLGRTISAAISRDRELVPARSKMARLGGDYLWIYRVGSAGLASCSRLAII